MTNKEKYANDEVAERTAFDTFCGDRLCSDCPAWAPSISCWFTWRAMLAQHVEAEPGPAKPARELADVVVDIIGDITDVVAALDGVPECSQGDCGIHASLIDAKTKLYNAEHALRKIAETGND